MGGGREGGKGVKWGCGSVIVEVDVNKPKKNKLVEKKNGNFLNSPVSTSDVRLYVVALYLFLYFFACCVRPTLGERKFTEMTSI